ncbi:MAG: class I SAM-dependent methyltransferase [Candidatus Tenebribacter burtonii]|jgi:SAM-dependent methyltransferase|nr:class I SAM-dependent methyltransferase [Candidatus Tenebribacter burtonii]
MQYDKVKDKFAVAIDKFPVFRKMFYILLDMLLLRQWYVKREIKKYFPVINPLRFYDAGAGFGQYSYFILNKFKKALVHAVDIKTDYMDSFSNYAQKVGWQKFTIQQADLVDYIPKENFDLIIAIDILEHIEDDVQVLQNFRKVLTQGGKLIISSPSNLDESAKFTAEHVRPGYSREDICSKLDRAGFKIRSFEYSYGKFGQIYWKLALKIPLSLISKSKMLAIFLPIYYILFYPIAFGFMLLDYYNKNKIGTGVIVVAE